MMDVTPFLQRYRAGEWRDRIFRDMILTDVPSSAKDFTFLDIGCGGGFDGSEPLQASIAQAAGRFVGIEPDLAITPAPFFNEVHRCAFEEAPIQPGSIDVAYSVMLLEHLKDPRAFFDKLWTVLTDGGVFWALTVDSRHWFCAASSAFDRLGLKEAYLRLLLGKRGSGARYDNYPVVYASNSPAQISPFVGQFTHAEFHNFSRVGQCNAYFPQVLQPLVSQWDRWAIRRDLPGTLLVVRLQK